MLSEDEPQSEIEAIYQKARELELTLHVIPGHDNFLAIIGTNEFFSQFDTDVVADMPVAKLVEYAKIASGKSPSEAGRKVYDIWITDAIEENEPEIKTLNM